MANLNHIGIAVSDLDQMKKLFSLLGLQINHSEIVTEQGVKAHFLPLPLDQGHLELLEVHEGKGEEGTIAQFLRKKGPGIHHLAFGLEKNELNPLCVRLRAAGYRLIYDQPKLGAHKKLINFIHPASCGGILIELMEPG